MKMNRMKILKTLILLVLSGFMYGQIDSAKYYYELSIQELNQGNIESSLKLMSTSLGNDSTYIDTYILRGYVYTQTNRMNEAIEEYTSILKIDSTHLEALKNRALSKMYSNDVKGAIDDHTTRIEIDPTNSSFYFDRAYCYGLLQNFDKSNDDYTEAIKKNSSYKEAYANRGFNKINMLSTNGIIQPSKKQTKGACKDLEMARKLGDLTVEDMIYVHCK